MSGGRVGRSHGLFHGCPPTNLSITLVKKKVAVPQKFPKPRSQIARTFQRALILIGMVIAGCGIYFYYGPVYSFTGYAPEQPLPYSHKQHAGDLEIPCQYCHTYARRSEIAGIPSVSKCMNCHANLSVESKAIDFLKAKAEKGKPIEWVRVYHTPDHVWFSHKRHIKKGIKCAVCHGPVETLVVNQELVAYRMGFCLSCHQKKGAPTDCLTCHT